MKPTLAAVLLATLVLVGCASPEERAADRRRKAERARLEQQREADAEFMETRREEQERAREDAAERAGDLAEERRDAADEGARYRAFEREYARQLGKTPAQLTPDERAWIRSRF